MTFRLSRASARAVTLQVRTVAGTASTADFVSQVWVIRLPAGTRKATVPLTILADAEVEAEESLGIEVVKATNARGSGATSRVTITPPP